MFPFGGALFYPSPDTGGGFSLVFLGLTHGSLKPGGAITHGILATAETAVIFGAVHLYGKARSSADGPQALPGSSACSLAALGCRHGTSRVRECRANAPFARRRAGSPLAQTAPRALCPTSFPFYGDEKCPCGGPRSRARGPTTTN